MREMTDVLTDVIFTCQRLHMGEKSEAHDCTVSSKKFRFSPRSTECRQTRPGSESTFIFYIPPPPQRSFSASVRSRLECKIGAEQRQRGVRNSPPNPSVVSPSFAKAKDKRRDPLTARSQFFWPASVFLTTKQAQEMNRNITNTA